MRAAEIHIPGEGPVVIERPDPVPADGRLLVRVAAAPVTPLDLLCASGTSYFGRPQTPYIPGVQGVGMAGDRLVWFPTPAGMAPGDGSMAELVPVPEDAVVELPAGTDPIAFAALGLSAVAAYKALTDCGSLAEGEQVIVLGAGGVVGQAAVRLARIHGARRVIAGARSTAAQSRAKQAGADAVVALDTDDVATLAERFTEAAEGPVDLVIDPLFGPSAAAAARVLCPGGRLVNLGGSAAETSPLDSSTIRGKGLRVLGYTNNALTPEQRSQAITTIAEHNAAGRLAVAYETLPLTDIGKAWRRQAAGAATGRIVLTL